MLNPRHLSLNLANFKKQTLNVFLESPTLHHEPSPTRQFSGFGFGTGSSGGTEAQRPVKGFGRTRGFVVAI